MQSFTTLAIGPHPGVSQRTPLRQGGLQILHIVAIDTGGMLQLRISWVLQSNFPKEAFCQQEGWIVSIAVRPVHTGGIYCGGGDYVYCTSVTFLTFAAKMQCCSYAANLFTVKRVNLFTLLRCSYTVNLFIAINTWRFPHLTLGKTYHFCCTKFRCSPFPACKAGWQTLPAVTSALSSAYGACNFYR